MHTVTWNRLWRLFKFVFVWSGSYTSRPHCWPSSTISFAVGVCPLQILETVCHQPLRTPPNHTLGVCSTYWEPSRFVCSWWRPTILSDLLKWKATAANGSMIVLIHYRWSMKQSSSLVSNALQVFLCLSMVEVDRHHNRVSAIVHSGCVL